MSYGKEDNEEQPADSRRGNPYRYIVKQLRARCAELVEMLTWLDRRGGLGLEVHQRINAVLTKTRIPMTTKDFNFVCRVLQIFDGFDRLGSEEFWWRTDDKYAPITFFVSCNDLFYWASSDAEELTPENIGDLEKARDDVIALNKSNHQADALFCCRRRGMRPQGAYYSVYLPQVLWPLFDACGPERETGFGNPKQQPKEQPDNEPPTV